MLIKELIIKRRDGHALDDSEIRQFVAGIVDGSVSDAQIAAFCMTAFITPMTTPERVALTLAMAHSGMTLDWSGDTLPGPVLDKHSTGGIGDKTSLILAPVIAACGGFVPMISGRGLGHTGGTLDKMDAIPGYTSQPDLALFRRTVRDVGCAIVGATRDIAPADRAMYAVRDISGTVESLDLITASILSKKMAAGLRGLVMDVKFGSGAFMTDYNDARALADSIHGVANGGGLPCTVLLTDMNQALGRTAGNALEVHESIAFLRGEPVDPRLYDVTLSLCAELLLLGGLAADLDAARAQCESVIRDGRAADIFGRMVAALGGPTDLIDRPDAYLPAATITRPVYPDTAGTVQTLDIRQYGYAIIALGGGRRVADDAIDYGVGMTDIAAPGDSVAPGGTPLCLLHGNDDTALDRAAAIIRAAATIGPRAVPHDAPAIRDRMAANGLFG